MMKERGIDPRRLTPGGICTVCTKPFLKEVSQINELLQTIGLVAYRIRVLSVRQPFPILQHDDQRERTSRDGRLTLGRL